jgi:hypothetical protein
MELHGLSDFVTVELLHGLGGCIIHTHGNKVPDAIREGSVCTQHML